MPKTGARSGEAAAVRHPCQRECRARHEGARETRSSPQSRISRWSTVECLGGIGPQSRFAAVAGPAGVLAGGPIRGVLQAHLAVARVAKQPPASTPASLLDRTSTSTDVPATKVLDPSDDAEVSRRGEDTLRGERDHPRRQVRARLLVCRRRGPDDPAPASDLESAKAGAARSSSRRQSRAGGPAAPWRSRARERLTSDASVPPVEGRSHRKCLSSPLR
jgi:hypothetical protein